MRTGVDRHAELPAAYVHIPFCSAVCPYCDFAVVAGKEHLAVRYADAVRSEIDSSPPLGTLHSVYFGGGTPSHVSPDLLGGILDALRDRHGLDDEAEVSLEVNPEDFSEGKARQLRSLGFNRVSFGAQSFDDAVLIDLGRRHLGSQVTMAVETARTAGFGNISVDLIFGTPGESEESWARSVDLALAAGVDHVSCYALTVEGGTPLGRDVRAGRAMAPDPDVQADRYEHADRVLTEAGFSRYEVSNWARPGHECRYNLTVWAQGQYEAYGNGAHRFRDGLRSHNVRRLEAYLEQVESGSRPVSGHEPIRGWGAEVDRLFVGLRRAQGVAPGPGVDALVDHPGSQVLFREGVIGWADDRLRVLRPLLTDEVHRLVLDLAPPAGWVEPVDADIV